MKRRDLLRHLYHHGCRFVREGSDPAKGRRAPVKRHREILDLVVKKICKQLDVPPP
jgi:hypothetical protein